MSQAQLETRPEMDRVSKQVVATTTTLKSSGGRRVWQYRLRYRRARWKHHRHLYFARRHDAQARIDRLLSDLTHGGRYQPIVSITLDRRQVISQWEKVAGGEESP